ncbi:aminopeptidase N C-terminal domain-containing protein [Cyanobacteria bacterium FACHB-63]|nr:aminopeptidase N C-terminal domain-containing protein [Cyanobacteria bacterium FACHB-63]
MWHQQIGGSLITESLFTLLTPTWQRTLHSGFLLSIKQQFHQFVSLGETLPHDRVIFLDQNNPSVAVY